VRFDFLGNFVGVLTQALLLTVALSVTALLGAASCGLRNWSAPSVFE